MKPQVFKWRQAPQRAKSPSVCPVLSRPRQGAVAVAHSASFAGSFFIFDICLNSNAPCPVRPSQNDFGSVCFLFFRAQLQGVGEFFRRDALPNLFRGIPGERMPPA